MKEKYVPPLEWSFFIGDIVPDRSNISPGLPSWIPAERLPYCSLFKSKFTEFYEKCNFNDPVWEKWYLSPNCENTFPEIIKKDLQPFQRVLLVQIFRPDRVVSILSKFCTSALKIQSISLESSNLKDIYSEESTSTTPILIITTPGADPSNEIRLLAEKEIGLSRYKELAMGGGQQPLAIKMLNEAARDGDWLCLKNLHLVVSWVSMLEKSLKNIDINPEFRLWLTTESHPQFPSNLAQQSFKLAFESPPGMKKNLQQTISLLDSENSILQSPSQTTLKLSFLLSWLHSLLQERRNYIPQGWTEFYEFNLTDYKMGISLIQRYASRDVNKKSLNVLHGLLEEAIYGCRISNTFDLKVLRGYIKKYVSEKMINGDQIYGEIILPNSVTYKTYKDIVQTLKDNDTPDIFGLPPNIDRTVQKLIGNSICDDLLKLTKNQSSSLLFVKEEWKELFGPVFQNWRTLTENKMVLGHYPTDIEDNVPTNTFM